MYGAASAEEALESIVSICPAVCISDMRLPGMNGLQLFERITAAHPDIDKVLYMSGYTNNVIVPDGELNHEVHFLQKPFTVETLMEKVKVLLNPEG